MHSIMNDENLKNFGAILISEPHVWGNNKGRVISTTAAARQLFNATVAPVIDYASAVWMHTLGPATTKTIRQIQKLGGQAITGAFSSIVGAVSEAEAHIPPVKIRQ